MKYGLIPELVGRIPVIAALDPLDKEAYIRILSEPKNALMKQYAKLLDMDGYDCVAVVVNQTFNSDGMLFEYTQSRHQPDYFCFQDIATRKK